MAKGMSRGRRKIEMKKIENLDDRLITFSKRRAGIYKKASEISILCGSEIGIVMYSPAGKPFTFGMPTFDKIVKRFRTKDFPTLNNMSASLIDAYWEEKRRGEEANVDYDELSSHLAVLKEEGMKLAEEKKLIQDECWWEVCVGDLNSIQIEQLCVAMSQLIVLADKRARELNY